MFKPALVLLAFLLSLSLTGLIRHFALKLQMVDIPNHRSSHTLPTPRGGGLAFVLCFLIGLPLLYWQALLTASQTAAYAIATLSIASIGFLDDRHTLSAKIRLLGHCLTSLLALALLGTLPVLDLGFVQCQPGLLLGLCYWLGLVWLLNLYNFMDGIDGLAALEAVSVCLGMALVYTLGQAPQLTLLPLLLAAAVSGFLGWNFPPAKIFMGDAGSGFLGLILGLMMLQGAQTNPAWLWSWLILLAVFIVDASLTLLRRLLSGQPIMEAHRSHAYQWASRRYQSHKRVSLAVVLINGLWLLPIALGVGLGYLSGVIGLIIGYMPILLLAWRLKAGKAE